MKIEHVDLIGEGCISHYHCWRNYNYTVPFVHYIALQKKLSIPTLAECE